MSIAGVNNVVTDPDRSLVEADVGATSEGAGAAVGSVVSRSAAW